MANEAPGNIGPYRLLNVVHTSQTCRIWQAYDDRNKRMVGIKTLQEKFRRNREHIGSLRREYAVGRRAGGDGVIQVLAFDTDRGTPYMAMEWFSAPNMKQRILDGTEKIAHLLQSVIEQSAKALEHFHAAGWIHRDIKPDNFLVAEDGSVKLIDFGLAMRSRGVLGKLLTRKSKVQGTKSYMAPEQIRGRSLDRRADIYSFGCTIHELVSGKPPFTGVTTNELLNKHLKATPPSLETADANVTKEFSRLVRGCLAKNPADRPKTLSDFLLELRMHGVFKIPPRPPE